MTWRKATALAIGLAFAGIPLITTATCNPASGTFDFFRDDDDYGVWDVFVDDGWYYEDYYYDDYYYDDYHYDDCWFCF